jgi:hypothetical protein
MRKGHEALARLGGGLLSTCVFALAPGLTGCTLSTAFVRPLVEIVGRTEAGLSAASVTKLGGTYSAACAGRSAAGTERWTFVRSGAGTTDLNVARNDSDCVLTLTDVTTADGTYTASPSLPLDATDTYQASASAFALPSASIAFYGNAKIDALSFANDFTVTLSVSDTLSASNAGTRSASYATQNASVVVATVAAPNDTSSFASFAVSKDANNVVLSATGYAQLTAGSVPGQDYAIYNGTLNAASTLVDVLLAYTLASEKHTLASLTSLQIPASQFALGGTTLTSGVTRTIIVRNTVVAVTSYQLILVTFTP